VLTVTELEHIEEGNMGAVIHCPRCGCSIHLQKGVTTKCGGKQGCGWENGRPPKR